MGSKEEEPGLAGPQGVTKKRPDKVMMLLSEPVICIVALCGLGSLEGDVAERSRKLGEPPGGQQYSTRSEYFSKISVVLYSCLDSGKEGPVISRRTNRANNNFI